MASPKKTSLTTGLRMNAKVVKICSVRSSKLTETTACKLGSSMDTWTRHARKPCVTLWRPSHPRQTPEKTLSSSSIEAPRVETLRFLNHICTVPRTNSILHRSCTTEATTSSLSSIILTQSVALSTTAARSVEVVPLITRTRLYPTSLRMIPLCRIERSCNLDPTEDLVNKVTSESPSIYPAPTTFSPMTRLCITYVPRRNPSAKTPNYSLRPSPLSPASQKLSTLSKVVKLELWTTAFEVHRQPQVEETFFSKRTRFSRITKTTSISWVKKIKLITLTRLSRRGQQDLGPSSTRRSRPNSNMIRSSITKT